MSISYSLDTQVILILNLIDVQYLQKGVFSFEKGSNCQNHFSSGSLHPVKRSRPSKISDSHLTGKGEFPPCLTAIWKTLIYKTLWSLFVDGMQLPQGYTDPLWRGTLLFSRNSCDSLYQSRNDERVRWTWSHPVVLNLCINLDITKYKLKSQYVKLTQLWPLTVNCRRNDYTIEISVLIQIQFYNISTNVLSLIFKSFHQHFEGLWTT